MIVLPCGAISRWSLSGIIKQCHAGPETALAADTDQQKRLSAIASRKGTSFMTHDWAQTCRLLVAGSIPAFKAFFAQHPLETVRALGYTWEWGQPQAAFYLVANTQAGIENALSDVNRHRSLPLNAVEALETIRWDAGYFPYPAGLTGTVDELGPAWEAEAARLYDMTQTMGAIDTSNEEQYALYSRTYEAFLADLVTTCCEALAEIARGGLLGDVAKIDFYVGSTDENGDIVRDRDTRIRQMISRGSR
jgi:hypothetical protein